MSHEVAWTRLAAERVLEAAQYIAKDKPGAAKRWFTGIHDAVLRLSDFPKSGRMVPEIKSEEVREIQYGAYRVIYRVEEARMLILTVRRSERLLDPTEISGESPV